MAEIVAAIAATAQAVSQAKQAFWDPPKVALLDNLEEIHGALISGVQVLAAVREDFENKVEKNKMKVPSKTYDEWICRANYIIDGPGKESMAKYKKQSEEESCWWPSSCPDFKEEMKKMLEKVINLVEESNGFSDKMLVDRAPEPVVKRKEPDIRDFETLRKPLEKILDWLKSYKVKGIGICGTVGVGKTTVMLNLNNHDQVGKMFDMVIWLTVSKGQSKKNLSREHLQQAIAQRLKLTLKGTSNADEVAERISMELKGKKYLLLLDDVKESLNINKIGIPTNNGSKIVLTTRLHHFFESKMVDRWIKVPCLSSNESWKMFQYILGNKELIQDPKTGPLAWQVCRECCGLPLLIKRVANTFRLKNTERLWIDGLNSWRMWPMKECEGIREIYELLRFCYNDLGDDRYKKCFLYAALYPEDTDINKDSLLECCAAEDLLGDGNDSNRAMIGDLALTSLENVLLLEEDKSKYYVTMDKFIRQVALYISEDNPDCKHLVKTNKKLRQPPEEASWCEKNRISLADSELNRLPDSPNCSILSTLFLQKNVGLQIIPPAFFKYMTKLRVLDLSHTGITSLPSSPSILISLKVLHLNNCRQMVELPSFILELENLESLDIHGSGINYIPHDIEKLTHLKRLWVSFGIENATQDVNFNYEMISKLSKLEELVIDVKSLPELSNEVGENIMREVAKLSKFKRLRLCFSDRIVDVIEIAPNTIRVFVPKATMLLSYIGRRSREEVSKIDGFRYFIGCQNSEYRHNDKFATYDKYVMYCNGVGSHSPILEVLAETEGFVLVNHKEIKQLSDFKATTMENIQGCLIESCNAMETIIDTMASELLPNLEQLFIHNLPMLRNIWKGPLQDGSLTKLTTLVLTDCHILVKVFPPEIIQQLCKIKYLKIEKCNEIEEIIPELDAVGNLSVLPKLEKLILFDMNKLSNICAIESLVWPSLEKFEIFKCPVLHKLPFNKSNAKNLKLIVAEQDWWGALQWQNEEDKEWLQEFCIFKPPNDAAL